MRQQNSKIVRVHWERERGEPKISEQDAPSCRNCGTGLDDRFCPSCGQDSTDPPQNAASLVGVFVANLVGLESRAIRSFSSLLFNPGRLTRAFVDGQRVRYSHPVQLYLWCTAGFFLTQTFFPLVRLNPETGGILSSLSAVSIGTGLSPETLQHLEDQGTPLAVFAERFDAAVTAYFPVLLVALVAASAVLMAIQYRREPALKHVVFSLHWTAFYFMLEMVRQFLPRLGLCGAPVSILATVMAVTYLYVAMRVVYRRGRLGTGLRALLTIVAFAALLGGWLWSTTVVAERIA